MPSIVAIKCLQTDHPNPTTAQLPAGQGWKKHPRDDSGKHLPRNGIYAPGKWANVWVAFSLDGHAHCGHGPSQFLGVRRDV
jgi:hypothetical protein